MCSSDLVEDQIKRPIFLIDKNTGSSYRPTFREDYSDATPIYLIYNGKNHYDVTIPIGLNEDNEIELIERNLDAVDDILEEVILHEKAEIHLPENIQRLYDTYSTAELNSKAKETALKRLFTEIFKDLLGTDQPSKNNLLNLLNQLYEEEIKNPVVDLLTQLFDENL